MNQEVVLPLVLELKHLYSLFLLWLTQAYDTIIANSRFFNNDISLVPKMALTVGVGTVMDAREVIIVITGAHKALALANCIEEGVNHMYTVSTLQMHPHAMIVCDDDATLELKVKTVKVKYTLIGLMVVFQEY
jgi:glucosamine-6-phosphate deaminase